MFKFIFDVYSLQYTALYRSLFTMANTF